MDKVLWQYPIADEATMRRVAATLAQLVTAGQVILLAGELGAGKTSFSKGFAKGLGISTRVKSPTFTLVREYDEGRLPLYHMDMYRLEDIGGDGLGLWDYFDGDGVSLVEWASFIADDLPSEWLHIHVMPGDTEISRVLHVSAQGEQYEALAHAWHDALQTLT